MGEINKVPDLSWMWHCSDNPDNILNYNEMVDDKNIAIALNRAVAVGFRLAMRRMEELSLIEMQDIDRCNIQDDQKSWDNSFKSK